MQVAARSSAAGPWVLASIDGNTETLIAAMKASLDLSQVRFLVADDSRFMCRLVVSVLKAFGSRQVDDVATGQEAYEAIRLGQYDIVLLDWEFPDRSGESVMRSIRKPGHPGAYQTVIMMSGHDEQRRIERALRFGVNGYVAKPVAPATLYAQIRQTILFPRPYLRTEHYFGPQHPLITDRLRDQKRPVQTTELVSQPRSATPAGEAVDVDGVLLFE
jgi:two-component system chemotaxis response regulator CheY